MKPEAPPPGPVPSPGQPPSAGLLPLGTSASNTWQVGPQACNWVRPVHVPEPLSLPALPKPVTLDLRRTALVVVDMQNDFCHPQGWLASIGVDVQPARAPIAPLQSLLPLLRQRGVPVLWVNWGNRPDRINLSPALLHVYNPDGRSTGLGGELQQAPEMPGRSRRVLEKDSWGADVVEPLQVAPGDVCIDKFRMSGFWDTCLDATLRNLGVQTLLFAGVNADQCVLATLMDANFLGYDCLMLEDCCATTSPDYCWQATLYNVRQCFGFTGLGADLGAQLQANA